MPTPIERARELGKAAWKRNASRIPALDTELMTMISENRQPVGGNVAVLDAWLHGWDSANLNRGGNTSPRQLKSIFDSAERAGAWLMGTK